RSANQANKGHVIHSQVMDEPWSKLDCCILAANEDWYRVNPIAAKRALRAIYRSADALPADRADAAKLATDRGLFGGAANVALVREAANMVPVDDSCGERGTRRHRDHQPGAEHGSHSVRSGSQSEHEQDLRDSWMGDAWLRVPHRLGHRQLNEHGVGSHHGGP